MHLPENQRVQATELFIRLLQCLLLLLPLCSIGQNHDSLFTATALKKLSLQELMDVEVVSVSKRLEKLREAASAIQVITQQDIRAAGAKTVPEALRLAPNLQVAQVNASQWAISARGFNNVLANKLLVLIDGRTVYTPLYAGVFWDVQNLLLEDIDRIEVISGPGGTLWGANAVNGVINIITKDSKDTRGLYVEGAIGNTLPGLGSLRYGGRLGKKLSYRVYGTGFKMGSMADTSKQNLKDDWSMLQGGLQVDWEASEKDKLTLQQNIYTGDPNPDGSETPVKVRGDNIVARWHHAISARADFQLQVYYDHTWRDFGNTFTEDLKTYDIDWQNRYQLGRRHILTYGLNYRFMDHTVTNLELFAFLPSQKDLYRYSLFAQDEIMLIKDRLRVTAGAKIERNNYTGFEYQPNLRFTWNAARNQTVWAAVSRAVRTPARTDRDFFLYLAPNLPLIAGNDGFEAENLFAYEAGYRSRLRENLTVSLAAFYNSYDDIRSAEPGPPPLNIPITFGNGVKGNSYGLEFAATYQPVNWWNLRGGYTFLNKDLTVKTDSKDMNGGTAESNDPRHQFLIQSAITIPGGLELGAVLRYVDKLPRPYVSSHTGLDIRLGWHINKVLEINVTGQHILDDEHLEFIPSSPSPRMIKRSVYGSIICRL
jgi:Outer membrane receptor for ferrienterochelin and colicins